MKILSASVSTTTYSRAYLQSAWKARSTLTDYERNGFSIFFYVTVTGHIEATMAELMGHRIMCSRSVIVQLPKDTISGGNAVGSVQYPTLPIHNTLFSLLNHFDRRVNKAPLDTLIELFQEVFDIQLSSLLGDTYQDLKALVGLRNVFAHGRDLWLQFNQDDDNLLSLDRNPLQLPAQRLLAAKILTTLQFDGKKHNEFQQIFFSDAAMLYFLDKAREIEGKLKVILAFPPEKEMPLMVSLPELVA